MLERELMIGEAQPQDAEGLVALLQQVKKETSFVTFDAETVMTVSEMEHFIIQSLQSEVHICLVAKLDEELIGVLNLSAGSQEWNRHIGDVFIAVAKPYWGKGVGTLLMELMIDWAEHTPMLRRLELTVQTTNAKAVTLYQKFGFDIEGTKRRGVKTQTGEFLDVYVMGKLINGE